jgi:hypothetical protein
METGVLEPGRLALGGWQRVRESIVVTYGCFIAFFRLGFFVFFVVLSFTLVCSLVVTVIR